MTVVNQKPAELQPIYDPDVSAPLDPPKIIKSMIAEPLFQPLAPPGPARITDDSGTDLDVDAVTDTFLRCCGDTQAPQAEALVRDLMARCMAYYEPSISLNALSLFPVQAAKRARPALPLPSPVIVYSIPTDVIPSAKDLICGRGSPDVFFASLAFCFRPETLGAWFANEIAFDEFKAWFAQYAASRTLPAETVQLVSDFANVALSGLTESLILRNSDGDALDPDSFARVLVDGLLIWLKQANPAQAGLLPFHVGELICPRTLVFVDADRHAHATANQIQAEWDAIRQSIAMKVNVVSTGKIQKLTAVSRAMRKAQAASAAYQSAAARGASRSANVRFRRRPPTTADIVRTVKKILSKMRAVNRSQNIYTTSTMTYQKPNRRDPDDFNKRGKSVSSRYHPDLHVYIDTSGSISEENYEDSVKACIALAMKLNVDIYFNSFSHVMSSCVQLKTKDRSARQVYAEFQRVPKVTGGTDYEQIWRYIAASKKRRRELSLLITDFEWLAPNRYVEHPKNLYYIPCSHVDWDDVKRSAVRFAQSMLMIEPRIDRRIIV